MRIAVGMDHGGYLLRSTVIEFLQLRGHEVLDFGTDSPAPADYPDFARLVGKAIQRGDAERGVLVCGSGVGISIAANKLVGVRACVCHDTYSARQGVEHDAMNVLCLGARVIGDELARELLAAFLSGAFRYDTERYVQRLRKVEELEARTT